MYEEGSRIHEVEIALFTSIWFHCTWWWFQPYKFHWVRNNFSNVLVASSEPKFLGLQLHTPPHELIQLLYFYQSKFDSIATTHEEIFRHSFHANHTVRLTTCSETRRQSQYHKQLFIACLLRDPLPQPERPKKYNCNLILRGHNFQQRCTSYFLNHSRNVFSIVFGSTFKEEILNQNRLKFAILCHSIFASVVQNMNFYYALRILKRVVPQKKSNIHEQTYWT